MNLSLLPKLQGPGGRGEPGGVPLRNEQLTGHSASTHPRSRATSWQQTPLPQGLHVTCWEEPKYLPSLPWGRREGTELLTQSPHGRMARGSDPAWWGLGSCLSRRGVRSASQNRVGRRSRRLAPSRPTAGHTPHPSHRGLCLPTSRRLGAPAHGRPPPPHPLSTPLQAPSRRARARSTPGWGATASLTGRVVGKVTGSTKPWMELSRLQQLHLAFTRGAAGPLSAVYLTVEGPP